MIINNAKFLKSAADKSGFMQFDKPVIAICGRSNVGKSSFINILANQKKLAKTSSEPGRTRLVNYFDMGSFVFADLPGYGFAQVSKQEKIKWATTIEDYFNDRENIAHAFVLVDIRHKPSKDDVDFINYLYHYIIPFTVICTKADKLSKTRIKPAVKDIANFFKLGLSDVCFISNDNGMGKQDVLDRLDKIVEVYHNERLNGESEQFDQEQIERE